MTIQELQQLFYIEKLIQTQKDRLDDLRASVGLKSPVLSDIPRAPGVRDRIGEIVPEIADEAIILEKSIQKYTGMRDRLRGYIDHVPNARIKLILTLRFIDLMPWQDVADAIGGKETEYSVKHACYRYVEGRGEPTIPGQTDMVDANDA